MIYNILLIDENDSASITKKFLEGIEDKNVVTASDQSTLLAVLQENDTHIIIINTQVVELSTLSSIFDKSKLSYDSIPILIIGKSDPLKINRTNLLIYDYIDIGFDKDIIFNKIRFCQQLYRKELQHESNIKKLLYIDGLTQLPNRVKLIKDVQDDSIGIDSLAVIDINSFKEINDFFGHRIGDNVLKYIVDIIDHMIIFVKDKVTLYKFSADVYCLANHGLSHTDFEDIIVFILGSIEGEILREGEHEIDIRATAGITFSPKNNKLITADLALQSAKKQNKDYLVFYEELDNIREYQNNMLWTKNLKKLWIKIIL